MRDTALGKEELLAVTRTEEEGKGSVKFVETGNGVQGSEDTEIETGAEESMRGEVSIPPQQHNETTQDDEMQSKEEIDHSGLHFAEDIAALRGNRTDCHFGLLQQSDDEAPGKTEVAAETNVSEGELVDGQAQRQRHTTGHSTPRDLRRTETPA